MKTLYGVMSLLTVVVVASACSDSRCNPANCKTMVAACRVEFGAEPNLSACLHADGGRPQGFDFSQYCPAACNAQEGGKLTQCLADHAGECSDAGIRASEVGTAACIPPSTGPTASEACEKACEDTRRTCEKACPQSSFQECMDCAATCGLHASSCWKACPKS